MTKFIFVTGGVVSSVGKGIAVASIGRILKSRNISVSVQKLDPYLNVDPGTMSPYQHGEVFVTRDGAETDLDLGHYERFIDIMLTKPSSVTSGQIYNSIISRERQGGFLGGTIQVIPHVTNEIKRCIRVVAEESGADVVIVEVGGTVGDIEGQPFLEAIRQLRTEVGRDNVMFVHLTLLPYLQSTFELKTKPTQHSVNELRRMGIQPDVIILRSDLSINDDVKDKIALFCDVERRAVIALPTLPIIYEIPLVLEEAGLGSLIVEKLDLPRNEPDFDEWRDIVNRMRKPKESIKIAIVGKYVKLHDSYISVKESLYHAAVHYGRDIELQWVSSEDLEQNGDSALRSAQGIVVPGGFGIRGIEGMIIAARYARTHGIPYLGLCLGMQVMVIEFARYILGSDNPNTTECDPKTAYPVIDLLPEQRGIEYIGGTMRLGEYPCHLAPGSKAAKAYQEPVIHERHRHRYEFNNDFRKMFEDAGMCFSGLSPNGHLVEISEIRDHPFMVACQFHPEFLSRPDRPHPLFREFIRVAKDMPVEGSQPALQI
ncbi:MAG: CTP synthase [Dehalococcoidia bacterium]|jgi:CTP synthase